MSERMSEVSGQGFMGSVGAERVKAPGKMDKVRATREERTEGTEPRSMSVPVVTPDLTEYRRVVQLVTAFRSALNKLASIDLIALMSSSGYSGEHLIPRPAVKQDLLKVLGCETKGKPGCELRPLLYKIWGEMQESVKQANAKRTEAERAKAREEAKAEKVKCTEEYIEARITPKPELPDMDSKAYNALQTRMLAMVKKETFDRMKRGKPTFFERFGIPFFHVDSAKQVEIFHVSGDDVRIRLTFGNQSFDFVAAGKWTKKTGDKEEEKPKTLNPATSSKLRQLARDRLRWCDAVLRLRKDRLFIDFSYHEKVRKQVARTGYLMEVSLWPDVVTVREHLGDTERYVERTFRSAFTVKVVKKGGGVPVDSARFSWKGINSEATLSHLKTLAARGDRIDSLVSSARSNWDHRSRKRLQERRHGTTVNRDRYVKHQNHIWSREVVFKAKQFGVDTLVVRIPSKPKLDKQGKQLEDKKNKCLLWTTLSPDLWGYPWQWKMLREYLKYKTVAEGLTFEEQPFEPKTEMKLQPEPAEAAV